ncbi:MAG: FAD-dependent oxidoreductase [Minwuia sp.]|nr:FAD-dependent oxidoreductase [Minwuia sp.]
MSDILETDICVIGGGSGGLSVAAGASQMGAPTILIEGGEMGGDCLNYGCVPSKALLAAGHHAHAWTGSAPFGVTATAPTVDFPKVVDHVRAVIDGIAPVDSQERFEGMGVTVIRDWARFIDERTIEAGGQRIRARRFVIATGSSAVAPPIPGLADVPYLTNETLFENREQPAHLLIIGGGPIGLEMAQAHRRLGSKVTVFEAFRAFGKDDPELTAIALERIRADGVDIREGVKITSVEQDADGHPVIVLDGDEKVSGSHLLVAAGRQANVAKLNLDAAGINHSSKGIQVDARLRTSNRRVHAIGDVAGGLQFTHVAGYHAGIVIRNMLFRLPAKARTDAVPWGTYTDPELAWVGLQEEQAKDANGEINVLRWPFAENDRASAERVGTGFIKVITTKKGRILGAGIVGAHAGELIGLWALAISKEMKIGDVAGAILPYPTLGEVSKRAAGQFFTPKLFNDRTRMIVKFLAKFG